MNRFYFKLLWVVFHVTVLYLKLMRYFLIKEKRTIHEQLARLREVEHLSDRMLVFSENIFFLSPFVLNHWWFSNVQFGEKWDTIVSRRRFRRRLLQYWKVNQYLYSQEISNSHDVEGAKHHTISLLHNPHWSNINSKQLFTLFTILRDDTYLSPGRRNSDDQMYIDEFGRDKGLLNRPTSQIGNWTIFLGKEGVGVDNFIYCEEVRRYI